MSNANCLTGQRCSIDGACAEPAELNASGRLKNAAADSGGGSDRDGAESGAFPNAGTSAGGASGAAGGATGGAKAKGAIDAGTGGTGDASADSATSPHRSPDASPEVDGSPLTDGGSSTPCASSTWSRQFGIGQTQFETGVAVTTDSRGNIAVAGRYGSGIRFDDILLGSGDASLPATGQEPVVVEFDGCGHTRWATAMNGIDVSLAVVATGPDDAVVVGGSDYVAKFDRDGHPIWATQLALSFAGLVTAMTVDPTGNVFVGGYGAGSTGVGIPSPGFVVKLDPNGTKLWQELLTSPQGGTTPVTEVLGLGTDSTGNAWLSGVFTSTSLKIGSKVFQGGHTNLESNGFVVKIDPQGVVLSAIIPSGAAAVTPGALAVGHDGAVSISGDYSDGTVDFGEGPGPAPAVGAAKAGFVVRFSASGTLSWNTFFPNGGCGSPCALAVDAQGNVGLAGDLFRMADFGGVLLTNSVQSNVVLALLDSQGHHRFSALYGDATSGQRANSIAFDRDGYAVITGDFLGQLDFGHGPLVSLSGGSYTDMFVAKLALVP
jgi:hypothetical protein